jgi:dihydrofolate reductase
MRNLVYYVASTIDGFIAHADGTLGGFLMEGEHVDAFTKSLDRFDAVFMGRATYELGRQLGVANPYASLKRYVFSRTLEVSPDPAVELVSLNAADVVRSLKVEHGKDIWLCGGANLASGLFADRLIDEVILKVNPVVFGAGISLFSGLIGQAALELVHHEVFSNGVVLLRYHVKYPLAPAR